MCYRTGRAIVKPEPPAGGIVPLKELQASLAQGPKGAYVVVGPAEPLVDAARAMVEEAVRPRIGPPAFNHGRFRAGESGEAALAAARTLPMMAPLRLVDIRDLHEGTDAFYAALCDYLQAPSESTVIVATGAGFPKVEKGGSNWAVRVKHALRGHGLLVTVSAESVPPKRFAIDAARKRGKELPGDAAERLLEAVGTDLSRIEQEVEKLALYVGEAPVIDARAISEASALLAEAVIWDLTTGLATRDAGLALEAVHRLQAGGDDARKLLAMVLWQMRELMRAAELAQRGASNAHIIENTKVRAALLAKVRPTLERGFPSAAALLRRIATANRYMNSHRAGEDRILEGLVLEMLEGRLRRPPALPRR